MKQRHIWYILLANGLFAALANLLFLINEIQHLWSVLWQSLLLGAIVYLFQISLTWYLVKKYASDDWLGRPFAASVWVTALGAGVGTWLLFNGIYALRHSASHPASLLFSNSYESLLRFLSVFLLNSLPGALIEEFLFRYLPVRYAESRSLSKPRAWLLYLGVLVLFVLVHIPAYLLRDQVPLSSLWSPFTMGIAFFFVYYTTRSVPFTALFHAFTNNPWFIYGPRESTDYSIVILVSIAWYIVRSRQKTDYQLTPPEEAYPQQNQAS
ncbi:type II CAAX prenyl endopeptidase Rce1 family protein [Telluribacter sp.]|jgi:membrane protease YdiL (CAAX protease family)|uniref:CPBP family glutamic-type intramembrane protease n=1 Tax=Telluribacter sp. TaxID=1978767 RepID=UPI002E15E430|nr:CPBP family glutamic-type intramembrane protease [Telluribacter sp.]